MTAILLWMALCGTAFPQNSGDFVVDANGVITRYNGFDSHVVIPAEIGGKKITAIGREVFQKSELTDVTIGGNVAFGVGNFASFDNDFDKLYNNSGKVAGTYTRDAWGNWIK